MDHVDPVRQKNDFSYAESVLLTSSTSADPCDRTDAQRMLLLAKALADGDSIAFSFASVLAACPSSRVRGLEVGPPDAIIGRWLWRKQGNVAKAQMCLDPAISHRMRI